MPRDEIRPGPAAPGRRRTNRYTDDPVSLGLRKLWQNAEREPVPVEFLDLLDAIDAAELGEVTPDAGAAQTGGDTGGIAP